MRPDRPAPPGRARRAAVCAAAFALAALFGALGAWQVERRAWKHDLVARVDARIHAEPVPFDPAAVASDDEYRRVAVAGAYLPVPPALVQAVTVRGGGFWVLAPLRTDAGGVVLVNRGFVPSEAREAARAVPSPSPTRVVGLLRLAEPGGGFLRANDPAADRWFSRDVAAIAASRGLGPVPPVFVDAEADPAAGSGPAAGGGPVGGLTVVAFPDNHLVYALTWFALAAMTLGYLAIWLRTGRRGLAGPPEGR